MTKLEYLLWKVGEEASEVIQRASKAATFGIDEIQEGQGFGNLQRVAQEVNDFYAVIEMLEAHVGCPSFRNEEAIANKKAKVEKYMLYSQECGTLDK